MTKEVLHNLTEKFLNGTITVEEKKLLEAWYYEGTGEEAELVISQPVSTHNNETELKQDMLRNIRHNIRIEKQRRRIAFLKPLLAAASILAIAFAAIFFFSTEKDKAATNPVALVSSPEILPGKEGAILTLSDGTEVVLDSLGNGVFANQGASRLMLNNGQLIYTNTSGNDARVSNNIMTTPKGRQFKVVLPDGTNVWMNAESRLEYPTSFVGERKVKLTGEAYFEVVPDKNMPFKVLVNDHEEVKVYGTKFNINAYRDEPIMQATLLEGSVSVSASEQRILLKPGQQAIIQKSASGIKVSDADTEKVMAWKNGLFNFDDAGLQEVMRQLSRWYDIDVEYEGAIPDMLFGGEIKKSASLNDILLALEGTKVHFRIEKNRKLMVLP